jgi:hypothetical protein
MELAYTYAKTDRLHGMEDFLGMTNFADIMDPTSPSGSVSTLSGLGMCGEGWEGVMDVKPESKF